MLGKLNFLRSATWPELFDYWRQGEESDPDWIKSYTSRGFTSWAEWRQNYVTALHLDQRQWRIHTILNPLVTVPTFRGGPFHSWIKKHYHGVDRPTFAELVTHTSVQQKPDLEDLIKNFPATTMLIGLQQGTDIIIIDGMHRACALALAAARQQPITANVTIALADASNETMPTVGSFSKKSVD